MTDGQASGAARSVAPAPQRPWTRFIDAATVVAVVTGTLYFYGWVYQAGFYRMFGLSIRTVDPATPITLVSSATAIAAIVLAAPFAILARAGARLDGPAARAWAHNGAIWLYLLAVAILWRVTAPDTLPLTASVVLLLVAAAGLGTLARRGVSAPDYLLGGGRGTTATSIRVAVVIGFLTLLGLFADAQGRNAAHEMVTEQAGYRPTVVLLMQDPDSWFHGRSFYLILHQQGLYYVTPVDQGDRDEPLLYVIQQDAVDVAVLRRGP
jgi:hypothetical protein